MAGKTLTATIVIAGRQAASFKQLGAALSDLGNTIEPVSEKLIDFGKDSVKTYADYQDAMLDAKVALRTQYSSTSELSKVMAQLDANARSWASSSRFTTDDVGNAISNAAHAGWDLEKILTGMPVAMRTSLAGGMDLANGLEYLIDITNASRIGFDQLGDFADKWTFAANRSSTTVPEMGEALQRMGSTLQFFNGDMAQAVTMLAILSNTGTKGAEAGTLLRNSMIRVIAPTQKAAEAMEGLTLTEQELAEIYSNSEGLEAANKLLKEAGFNAYDSKGNLKSFIDIYKELDKATAGMTEEKRNQVLSAIFPTKTITGALAFMEAAANGQLDAMYMDIIARSAGYTQYAADTMESGLGGALREVVAAWETLKLNTGDELADPVTKIANGLTGIINAANNMDKDKFSAMISALEFVAASGPALGIAGAAISFLGDMNWVKAATLGAVAIGAAMTYIHDLEETAYKEGFGSLTLESGEGSAIGNFLSGLESSFSSAYTEVDKYNQAMSEALTTYTTASSTLGENLIEKMLTGATLTQEDQNTLSKLGDSMRQAVLAGIDGSYSASNYNVLDLAGVEDYTELEKGSTWSEIFSILQEGYTDSVAQAEQLGRELRKAMTSAFEDGSLTEEEVANIRSVMDQYNALMAEIAAEDDYVEQQNFSGRRRRWALKDWKR